MTESVEATMPSEKGLPPQLLALVAPDSGMPKVAMHGRARWPLLLALVCSLSLAGAEALRVNADDETLKELDMSGQLKDMSDRQIAEQARGAERKFIVKSVAIAVIKPPGLLLGYLVSLYLLSWFLRGRSKGNQMVAVAGAALIPGAIADLLSAISAFTHSSLPTDTPSLIPRTATQVAQQLLHLQLPGVLASLGNALDFFSLWSALLFAFGLATAAQLPRGRAIATALVAWGLWRLLFACAFHLGG